MKTPFLAVGSVLAAPLLVLALQAQERPLQITRLGPDHSRVEWVTRSFDDSVGDWIEETHGYTLLGTGINHWNEESRAWEPSVEEISLLPVGAAALQAPHKVYFAPTLDHPDGSIDYLGADGPRLRSSILALSYFDPLTGRRATIGLVRNVQGELLPPNRVIYRDAFEPADPDLPVRADVVYTFRLSGLEQDVVLREFPPAPEAWGLSSEVARLEVLTEFFEAPEPERHARVMAAVDDEDLRGRVAEPDWIDERLDFGGAVIGAGRAFRLDLDAALPPSEPEAMTVGKRWARQDDRSVLIEAIDFLEALPQLLDLPGAREAAVRQGLPEALLAGARPARIWNERLLARIGDRSPAQPVRASAAFPDRPLLAASPPAGPPPPMLLSSRPLDATPGFVIDYVTMAVNSSDFTFRGDETYFVTNTVNLSGTTTLEGGAVVKYTKYLGGGNPTPEIKILGPFVSATSLYRPAIFTARDDQSVGQYIPGSAPMPDTSYYVLHGLWFQNTGDVVNLENVRFRHGWTPVIFWNCHGILRNSQFQYCANPVYANSAIQLNIRNMLAVDGVAGLAPFKAYYGAKIHAEHVTVANASTLINKDSTSQVTLVNCLLAGVTTFQDYIGRNDPAYGNFESASTASLFQSVGAGGYYLAPDSPHRNAGVTTIEGSLAADLATLTTYPPLLLTQHVTLDTTLFPQAQRDTDLPDRGYHYAPLDYCLTSLNLTNATLLLTNGIAVGLYGPKGLVVRRNGRLRSEGTPGLLNRLVRYNTVQEGTNNWGGAATNVFAMLEINTAAGAPTPLIDLRFTEVAHMAISTNTTTARRFLVAGASNDGGTIALSHSQVRGVHFGVSYASSHPQTVALTNNLFEGSVLSFMEQPSGGVYQLHAWNNLFFRGQLTLDNQNTNTWTLKDNLIDTDTLSVSGGYYNATHNGFRSGLTAFGSVNKTNLAPNYTPGPLGRFYYPPTGPANSLTNLIDNGSRTAPAAGMYHFTTQLDQSKEANSVVDIGFHYGAGNWLHNGIRFVGTDTTTQGNWKGVYGQDGYHIVNDASSLPAYGAGSSSYGSTYTWSSSPPAPRSLQRAATGRIAACWFTGGTNDVFHFLVHDPRPYRVAVYALDWDTSTRHQTIEICEYVQGFNGGAGPVLDRRTITDFNGGKYLVWDIVGSFVVRIINHNPASNGVLSGLFFGPAAEPFGAFDTDGDGLPDYLEDHSHPIAGKTGT